MKIEETTLKKKLLVASDLKIHLLLLSSDFTMKSHLQKLISAFTASINEYNLKSLNS